MQTLDHQSSQKAQGIQISISPIGLIQLLKSGELHANGLLIKDVSAMCTNPFFGYELFALKSKKLYKHVQWDRPIKSIYIGKHEHGDSFIELLNGAINMRTIIKESYALTLEALIN